MTSAWVSNASLTAQLQLGARKALQCEYKVPSHKQYQLVCCLFAFREGKQDHQACERLTNDAVTSRDVLFA